MASSARPIEDSVVTVKQEHETGDSIITVKHKHQTGDSIITVKHEHETGDSFITVKKQQHPTQDSFVTVKKQQRPTQDSFITVKGKDLSGGRYEFRIKRDEPLQKLMMMWRGRMGMVDYDSLRFVFHGRVINDEYNKTADDIGLKDGDCVDAVRKGD